MDLQRLLVYNAGILASPSTVNHHLLLHILEMPHPYLRMPQAGIVCLHCTLHCTARPRLQHLFAADVNGSSCLLMPRA